MRRILKCLGLSQVFLLPGWLLQYYAGGELVGYVWAYENWALGYLGMFLAALGFWGIPLYYYGFEEERDPLENLHQME